MRICLLHPYSWPDVRRGGERYVADLSRYLISRGHAVDLIAGAHASTRPSSDGVIRLRHIRFRGQGRWRITDVETFGLRALPHLLRRRSYDVVHTFTPSCAVASRVARHRTVFTVLGQPTRRVVAKNRIHRILFERAVQHSDAATVLSASSAEALRSGFGRQATVISPGVYLERFPPELRPRSGPPVLLFPAALDRREKGLDVLIASFPRVLDAHPDAVLELAGPGDPSWALRSAGEMRNRIDLTGVGEPDALPRRYARAHATVLPSRNEAFGLVLAESLACGTPVVASMGGGAETIVENERIGRLTPPGDPAALAEAIIETIRLARDPVTPPYCLQSARRWGWEEEVGPAHEELYGSIC